MNADTVNNADQPDDTWAFKLGEWITHRDQPMPSLVLSRVRTCKGNEIYGVRSFATVDPNRDRMMLGDSLVPMTDDHPDWRDCLLADTPFDPRVAA
ncbi:hypothetical protein BPNPMPFG_000317 [Mesorhizobium sp. AR07]|uniref:hypothetical protein n=1 Tax=Mesorhizobium sp. AR07 TaxID=2865838 RepID=UPI0021601665|nr:hypothetical protein [Mesorhizobium sp. AR07]UVK44852.1 hypothetical protein BPNPMPFG_000317 [Mesorhizobium sp. AR07]